MFINRKSRKLSQRIKANTQSPQAEDFANLYSHKEIEISSYPTIQYILGFLLLCFSIYLLYSACGGTNGIKGFNDKQWWQVIIAVLLILVGIGFIYFCQIESLIISRKDNWILVIKTRLFCFLTQFIKKQFTDLMGISVVKTGNQTINLTMSNYHIVLGFKTCDELPILRCLSRSKILDYFEEIRSIFTQSQIQQNKVAIQNLLF